MPFRTSCKSVRDCHHVGELRFDQRPRAERASARCRAMAPLTPVDPTDSFTGHHVGGGEAYIRSLGGTGSWRCRTERLPERHHCVPRCDRGAGGAQHSKTLIRVDRATAMPIRHDEFANRSASLPASAAGSRKGEPHCRSPLVVRPELLHHNARLTGRTALASAV